eukprot:m51a1_g12647 hypothetical protein (126) ;mRNA; f:3463-3840
MPPLLQKREVWVKYGAWMPTTIVVQENCSVLGLVRTAQKFCGIPYRDCHLYLVLPEGLSKGIYEFYSMDPSVHPRVLHQMRTLHPDFFEELSRLPEPILEIHTVEGAMPLVPQPMGALQHRGAPA